MWIFSLSVLPKKWRKVQPETETLCATHLDVGSNDNERPVNLTAKVVKELAYATVQGSFSNIWKCMFSDKDSNVTVDINFIAVLILNFSGKSTESGFSTASSSKLALGTVNGVTSGVVVIIE
ncbi:hypothetical protein BDR06DRAFT_972423 [Suillus hirtellus]|nr:hypothetical protein BDR06DRAFT_972423 [Suillus hirtellus]